jgi:hypothetical protein
VDTVHLLVFGGKTFNIATLFTQSVYLNMMLSRKDTGDSGFELGAWARRSNLTTPRARVHGFAVVMEAYPGNIRGHTILF